MSYKDKYQIETRRRSSTEGLGYGKIPIICEKRSDSAVEDLEKKKFLVAPDVTVGVFIELILEKINASVSGQIYLYISDSLLAGQAISMNDLYNNYKDDDGFLYINYANEPPRRDKQIGAYKSVHPFAERQREATDGLGYKKIPIICEKFDDGSDLPDLEKKRFLIAPDATVGLFEELLREKITTQIGQPIHLLIADGLLTQRSILMSDLYRNYKDDDGYLYVNFTTKMPTVARQIGGYKSTHTPEQRGKAANRALEEGKVPIICERMDGADLRDIEQKKFTMDMNADVPAFVVLLRERLELEIDRKLYLHVNGRCILPDKMGMKELYESDKEEDNLLYVYYTDEKPANLVMRATAPFKSTHTLEERKEASRKGLNQGKIPIICEKNPKSNIREVVQRKFYVAQDMKLSTFMVVMKERLQSEAGAPVFLYLGSHNLLVDHVKISDIYRKYKDTDGFLYTTYCGRDVHDRMSKK